MHQTDLKIIHTALDAMRQRDHAAAAALFTPDAEWHNTAMFPGQRVCVGVDAIVDFWRLLAEDMEIHGNEVERVSGAGGRVVVEFHQWGCGRTSGVPFDLRYAAIFELVDERISRVEIHGSYEKAVAAAPASDR